MENQYISKNGSLRIQIYLKNGSFHIVSSRPLTNQDIDDLINELKFLKICEG